MKANKNFLSIVGLLVSTLIFCSCKSEESKTGMTYIFPDNYYVDDVVALEDVLTTEYEIDELTPFFKNSFLNEGVVINPLMSTLSFEEVNQKFPVEIIRTKGYSVYKVRQGGYFYVFWVNTLDTSSYQTESNLVVYFSAYIPASASNIPFDSLVPNDSTAEDVKRIDPSLELSFFRSHGVFSYSFLNENSVLQIEYTHQGNIEGYDDLVIKELTVVARNLVPSRYSTILSSDLPERDKGDKGTVLLSPQDFVLTTEDT